MQLTFRVALLSLTCMMMICSPAWAGSIPPEKIKTYAQLYPDLFKSTTHAVSHRTAGSHGQAVTLLLASFNGNTDVEALSAVLRPSDRGVMKSDAEIKQALATKGLSWVEYQEITHALAHDSQAFTVFLTSLDQQRFHRDILSQTQSEPELTQQIRIMDHQIILKNLLVSVKR